MPEQGEAQKAPLHVGTKALGEHLGHHGQQPQQAERHVNAVTADEGEKGRQEGAPGRPCALVVLAIAQMGVHLVFFLHITTGADNTNNVLALAFGLLIVFLVIGGSLWIMDNLNHNMLPMDQIMQMQR